MSLEAVSIFSVYATTVIWCAIAVWAYVECWREWGADRKELKRVRSNKLILLIPLAEDRFSRAKYFVKMAHVTVVAGIASAYLLYLSPPPPESSLLETMLRLLIRIAFIYLIYCFLRAKLTDRGSRERARARQEA